MQQQSALGRASLASRLTRRGLLRGAFGVVGALATTTLIACGGRRTAGGADIIVQMTRDNTFSPKHVSVLRGYTVYWTNVTEDTAHTVTCDPSKAKNPQDAKLPDGAKPFDSEDVAGDTAWSYTFDTPGEYTYFCKHHEADGMIGTITVRV